MNENCEKSADVVNSGSRSYGMQNLILRFYLRFAQTWQPC